MFTSNDHLQIKEKGLAEKDIKDQLDRFQNGFSPICLSESATINNGIKSYSDNEKTNFVQLYEKKNPSVLKFVPASGAATRMFKHLFELLQSEENVQYEQNTLTDRFFSQLDSFAFLPLLADKMKEKGYDLEEERNQNRHGNILKFLLLKEGLGYGSLPKGLLQFHQYEKESNTPVQEHLKEGLAYAFKNGSINIHFTVSPEHQEVFEKHVKDSIQEYDQSIEVTFSTQQSNTDTLAVDLENTPFRDPEGKLLFRPSGHGALLENLNKVEADIVFIKNIDNVFPERMQQDTIIHKKLLAGVLLSYQEKIFSLLKSFDNRENPIREANSLLSELGIRGDFDREKVVKALNRPIRVCGMVKNEGEPGGGPFWVRGKEGTESLQIVESAQIDSTNKEQENILRQSTHFNPVDLVCGVKNYKGEKFDLLKYRDPETGFIVEKSSNGKRLRAMELPGLWNGSMADWNTIFVEVPITTFSPVKTVNDLLKEDHQQFV